MHELIKCIPNACKCTAYEYAQMLFITKISFSFIPKPLDIYLSAVCLCAWGCVCVCAHTGSSSCTTLLWMVLNASHTHNDRRSVSSVSNLTQGEGLHPSVLTQYGTPPSPPLYPPPPTHTHTYTQDPVLYVPYNHGLLHTHTRTRTRRPLLLGRGLHNLCSNECGYLIPEAIWTVTESVSWWFAPEGRGWELEVEPLNNILPNRN